MIASSLGRRVVPVLFCGIVAACQPPPPPPPTMSAQSPVALRAMQIRAFDTTDKRKVVQAVIAALQDLGYGIAKVDYGSGTITAAKLARLRLTAVVYPHGQRQYSVRANAMVVMPGASATQVDDPEFYQQYFFVPLEKAMFLAAQRVDDDPTAPTPAMLTEAELSPKAGEAAKPKGNTP